MISEFQCTIALKYCAESRKLLRKGKYAEAGQICMRVSKLCNMKGKRDSTAECIAESSLCSEAAKIFISGENIEKGLEICSKAVALCPRSKQASSG